MVDVSSIDDNAKTVFFSNMFNVITGAGLIFPLNPLLLTCVFIALSPLVDSPGVFGDRLLR